MQHDRWILVERQKKAKAKAMMRWHFADLVHSCAESESLEVEVWHVPMYCEIQQALHSSGLKAGGVVHGDG